MFTARFSQIEACPLFQLITSYICEGNLADVQRVRVDELIPASYLKKGEGCMAHFLKNGVPIQNVIQVANVGIDFRVGLWGPWYRSSATSSYDSEYEVSVEGHADATVRRDKTVVHNVRGYSINCANAGRYELVAKDQHDVVVASTTLLVHVLKDDRMHKWAQGDGQVPEDCCDFAIPYLRLERAIELDPRNVGPRTLTNVHGLAVHCTAGNAAAPLWQTSAYRCVSTWNSNRRKSEQSFSASAHFAISGDGGLVQFIPADTIAWAQGGHGDPYWISVEIDNDGNSEMTGAQFDQLVALFDWVTSTYPVEPQLAAGCLWGNKQFDDATRSTGCEIVKTAAEAAASTGLSTHWWLATRGGGHACPGPKVIRQLSDVVNAVSPQGSAIEYD